MSGGWRVGDEQLLLKHKTVLAVTTVCAEKKLNFLHIILYRRNDKKGGKDRTWGRGGGYSQVHI